MWQVTNKFSNTILLVAYKRYTNLENTMKQKRKDICKRLAELRYYTVYLSWTNEA
jgi:hypothetical protein